MEKGIKSYIGNKEFYRMVLTIAVPIMIQNGVSNFVSLLDNLMIGRVGTNALSGVAISNQLMFIYYLMVFGAVAGVGIFTAQYYGTKDMEGVRWTFRFKLIITLCVTLLAMTILYLFKEPLISLYLMGEGDPADAAETLKIGKEYMNIMLLGLIPCAFSNSYASTLRECGETKLPMKASAIAVLVNLIGNFLLIYGIFGLPAMGAKGAALATVISRFVETSILAYTTHKNSNRYAFILGAYRTFKVPSHLASKFLLKAFPLMINETLWSLGTTMLSQCYSYRSLSAVAAYNIESTLWNLLGVAFLAMGDAVGILIGHVLGEGNIPKAKDHAKKLLAFTTFCGVIFGTLQIIISPFFPLLYNTTDEVRSMATGFIFIFGLLMPLYAFTHASYFTIRAGGRVGITFLFDSCFVWLFTVPTAFCLSRFTDIDVMKLVAIVQSLEIVKCIIGGTLVHKGIWARNIIG